MSIVDCRASRAVARLQPMPLHDKRINTIHSQTPGASTGHSVVTSSSDACVKVWDVRALRPSNKKAALLQPVAELSHDRSCHGMAGHWVVHALPDVITCTVDIHVQVYT